MRHQGKRSRQSCGRTVARTKLAPRSSTVASVSKNADEEMVNRLFEAEFNKRMGGVTALYYRGMKWTDNEAVAVSKVIATGVLKNVSLGTGNQQALVGAGTVVLVWALVRRLQPDAAPLAGGLALVYGPLVTICAEVMSETLFCFWIVLAAWALVVAEGRRQEVDGGG